MKNNKKVSGYYVYSHIVRNETNFYIFHLYVLWKYKYNNFNSTNIKRTTKFFVWGVYNILLDCISNVMFPIKIDHKDS